MPPGDAARTGRTRSSDHIWGSAPLNAGFHAFGDDPIEHWPTRQERLAPYPRLRTLVVVLMVGLPVVLFAPGDAAAFAAIPLILVLEWSVFFSIGRLPALAWLGRTVAIVGLLAGLAAGGYLRPGLIGFAIAGVIINGFVWAAYWQGIQMHRARRTARERIERAERAA